MNIFFKNGIVVFRSLKSRISSHHDTPGAHSVNSRGVALILVLWVLVLLMVIVFEFSFSMRVEVNAARNFKDEITCYFNAVGGFERAVAELIADRAISSQEEEEEETKSWRTDQRKITIPMSNGSAEVMISDEAGKYNVNTISDELLRAFIGSLGVEEVERDIITDSILDWRDDNNLHRVNGAENDYYTSLPYPYSCKDGPFETVEELLLVRGVTHSLFYGCYQPLEEQEGSTVWRKGLIDLFTVYSRSTRVDINAAPKEILMSIPGVDEETAEALVKARSKKPLHGLKSVQELLGAETYSRVAQYLSLAPSFTYSIVSTGLVPESNVQRRVKGVVSINLGSRNKYQVVFWSDNYPVPEALTDIHHNAWDTEENQEPS